MIKTAEVLPEHCYTLLNSTGELIRIDRGESGYMTYKHNETGQKIAGLKAYEMMQKLNAMLGITDWRIIEAMEAGSMFGWNIKGANPETYRKLPDDPEYRLDIAKKFEK